MYYSGTAGSNHFAVSHSFGVETPKFNPEHNKTSVYSKEPKTSHKEKWKDHQHCRSGKYECHSEENRETSNPKGTKWNKRNLFLILGCNVHLL